MEKVFLLSMFAAPMIVLLIGLVFIITIPILLIINEKIFNHRVEKRLKKLQNKCIISINSNYPYRINIWFNIKWGFNFEDDNKFGFYFKQKNNSNLYNYLRVDADDNYLYFDKATKDYFHFSDIYTFNFINKLLKFKNNSYIHYYGDIDILYLVSPHELFHKFFKILVVDCNVNFKKLTRNELYSFTKAALFLKNNRFKDRNQPCFITHQYFEKNYSHLMRMIEKEVEKYKPSNKDSE